MQSRRRRNPAHSCIFPPPTFPLESPNSILHTSIEGSSLHLRFDDYIRCESDKSALNGTITRDTLRAWSTNGLPDTTSLTIVCFVSSDKLESAISLDLSQMPALKALRVRIVFDAPNAERVLRVWRTLLSLLRSLPATTRLERIELPVPTPLSALRHSIKSQLVQDLRAPLAAIDALLVQTVDRAPVAVVTLVAPKGERFAAGDWACARSFFPALWDYGMLECEQDEGGWIGDQLMMVVFILAGLAYVVSGMI